MPRTGRRRMFSSTVAAAALASLTGCALPFTTPVAVPTVPATQLPAAPSSATPPMTPTGAPPALANTGTNWAPMLAALLTYGQWLLANPGAGTVATVAAAGCPENAQLATEMTSLNGEGWRLAPAPIAISSVGAPAALAPGQTSVMLPVRASRAAETIVDTGGRAASAAAALPPTAFDVTLLLGGDGKWRLCSATPALAAAAIEPPPSLF